jgi:hypothetical protein
MYEIFIHDNSIKLIFPNYEIKIIFESDKIIPQPLIKNRLGLIIILACILFNKEEDLAWVHFSARMLIEF